MKLKNNKEYTIKDYSKRSVNLLPGEVHVKSAKRVRGLILTSFILICVAAFAFYEFSVYQDTQDINDEILIKQAQIQSKRSDIENQKILISLEDRIQMKAFVLSHIYSTNRSIVDIIQSLESTLNDEIFLTGLAVDSTNTLVVSTSSTSRQAVSAIISKLIRLKSDDGSNYFSSVFVNTISRNEDEDGNVLFLFQINCEFEGGVAYEIK